jgi:long-chain acyl-CoA synthetase
LISNVLIHGDQRKYVVALITLDKTYLLNWAKQNGVTYSDYEALTQSNSAQDLVRKAVAEANSHLAGYESIKRFAILPSDFTVEGGELTPSLKVKRKMLDKKWAAKIESLYS